MMTRKCTKRPGAANKAPVFAILLASMALPAFGSQISVNLNSASSFGLLGGTISNTGTSIVTGNVGATTTITGFLPGTATGTVYPFPSNATVAQAYSDFESAWTSASSLTSTQSVGNALPTAFTFTGNNVYTFTVPTVTTIDGTNLVFDAQNNPNEVFVIQIGGAFNVIGDVNFTLENGANADNIFWVVGTAATISVGSSGPITFDGNILAGGTGGTFTMSAASGGSGVLAGTINGCVFTNAANTLAGETNVGGCASNTAAAAPSQGPSCWWRWASSLPVWAYAGRKKASALHSKPRGYHREPILRNERRKGSGS